MADTWIVTSYTYERHLRLDIAEREADRLRWLEPSKFWRVYRVKTTLPAGNTKAVLDAANDLLAYVGANIRAIKDPLLVALASKLQYECAVRDGTLRDEQLAHMELVRDHVGSC